MAGVPPKSAAGVLLALSEFTGDRLPVSVRNEVKSYSAALEAAPLAAKAAARAERNLAAAKKSAAVDDISEVLKQLKTGDFAKLDLGPDAVAVATIELTKARRYAVAVNRAVKASSLNVGDLARQTKLVDKLSRYWQDTVKHNLDRDKETYAAVADADRRSGEMAARIYQVLVVLDQPHGKAEAALLRDAVNARPPALPRLAPLLQAQEDEKRGVEQEAANAQIRRDTFRAAADGRVVSTGRVDLDDAERQSTAKTAARRSGHLEEVSK